MASKRKAPPTTHPRNAVQVIVRGANDTPDAARARELTRPSVQAAATIQKWQVDNQEVNALATELAGQVAAVNAGDMTRAEAMLTAQAHTLDELFNSLARRSHANVLGGYLLAAETYMRLALKAQSQCRATIETLANIKNPPVIYARQANIANGPQQVNNGLPRPRENAIEQSKLSGGGHELLEDNRTPMLAGGADPALEAVGEVHGTEDARG